MRKGIELTTQRKHNSRETKRDVQTAQENKKSRALQFEARTFTRARYDRILWSNLQGFELWKEGFLLLPCPQLRALRIDIIETHDTSLFEFALIWLSSYLPSSI